MFLSPSEWDGVEGGVEIMNVRMLLVGWYLSSVRIWNSNAISSLYWTDALYNIFKLSETCLCIARDRADMLFVFTRTCKLIWYTWPKTKVLNGKKNTHTPTEKQNLRRGGTKASRSVNCYIFVHRFPTLFLFFNVVFAAFPARHWSFHRFRSLTLSLFSLYV